MCANYTSGAVSTSLDIVLIHADTGYWGAGNQVAEYDFCTLDSFGAKSWTFSCYYKTNGPHLTWREDNGVLTPYYTQIVSGFCVYPQATFGASYTLGGETLLPPRLKSGCQIALNLTGTKGVISRHKIESQTDDSTPMVLRPTALDFEEIYIRTDGVVTFANRTMDEAVIFWIGGTPNDLPTENFDPDDYDLLTMPYPV